MGFWTGERLAHRLNGNIVSDGGDVEELKKKIDCNALTLRVGPEIYISPARGEEKVPQESIRVLAENESFVIPPGQFGFLVTEETLDVPADAIAFISMKAGLKFRGLVNVSGFHVDPGFKGRLVFSVFNAGPQRVIMRRGMDAFLIWFSDLVDGNHIGPATGKPRDSSKAKDRLDPDMLNLIAGEVHSLEGVMARIHEVEGRLTERLHAMEREQSVVKWAAMIAAGTLLGFIAQVLGGGG